jgi:hypothetical protein
MWRDVWTLRLLLAGLFLFGSEILLWNNPSGRPLGEWLALLAGYIALGAVILDLAARFRVRSLFDVMILAAIYALLNSLLLNPSTALEDLPRTLLTRVLGAHALLGLAMLGTFLAIISGKRREHLLLVGFSLGVSFFWGIWVRWSPSLSDWLVDEVSLVTMYGVAGLVLAPVLVMIGLRPSVSASDVQLSPLAWAGMALVLVALFLLRVAEETLTGEALMGGCLLIVLCLGMLWFQRGNRGLLDVYLPSARPPWMALTGAILAAASMAAFAYHLPLIDFTIHNQLSLMQIGFAAVGTMWLPLVAMAVGLQALDREARKLSL